VATAQNPSSPSLYHRRQFLSPIRSPAEIVRASNGRKMEVCRPFRLSLLSCGNRFRPLPRQPSCLWCSGTSNGFRNCTSRWLNSSSASTRTPATPPGHLPLTRQQSNTPHPSHLPPTKQAVSTGTPRPNVPSSITPTPSTTANRRSAAIANNRCLATTRNRCVIKSGTCRPFGPSSPSTVATASLVLAVAGPLAAPRQLARTDLGSRPLASC